MRCRVGPRFALLKGRRNYLCLNKIHNGGAADESDDERPQEELFDPVAVTALGRDVQRLTAWASTTDSGDRDDLKPGVADRSWSQVSVSARECLGVARCPFGSECFSERARGSGRRRRYRRHQSRAAGHRRRRRIGGAARTRAAGGRRGARVGRPGDVGGHRGADVGRPRCRRAADHPIGGSRTDRSGWRRRPPTSPRPSTTPHRAASITSTTRWRPT